jgi:superkiller protein 3
VDAWNAKGIALFNLARFEEALAAYDDAIKVDPNCSYIHGNRGNALHRLGRYEAAVEAFDRAITLTPGDTDLHFGRGNGLALQGRLEDALVAYDRALALSPGNTAACENRGVALSRLGRLAEALTAYDDTIRLEPKLVSARLSRVGVLLDLGKHEEAIAEGGRILELEPGHVFVLNMLAWRLATCAEESARDPARAIDFARRGVAMAPDNWEVQNTLGVALYRAGQLGESLKVLAESMRLNGGGVACDWYFAAMAHARLGEAEKARALYDRAVAWTREHAPDDAELRRFRDEAAGVLGLR